MGGVLNSRAFRFSHPLLLALLAATVGNASVVYSFVGTTAGVGGFPVSTETFGLAVPTFLSDSGLSAFSCRQLDSETNCGGGIIFDKLPGTGSFTAILTFGDKDGAAYQYGFPTGSFQAVGSYLSQRFGDPNSNSGALKVALSTSDGSPIPEPGSLLLAAAGLTAFLLIRFRRTQRLRPMQTASGDH
jgi:hypothetical protein